MQEYLHIQFEDERLDFKTKDLDLILQAYQELYPALILQETYFFFDEIQNIDGWEKFVRRCHEKITKNLFITGSNSKALSQDIATALRGRSISYEILPLSFKEYLKFKCIPDTFTNSAAKAKLRNEFLLYLQKGGYPEVVNYSDSIRNQTLQEYFDVMIYKDLIERYGFSNTPLIKLFLKRLSVNTTSYVSINKMYNEIKSQGYKLDKNLLYQLYEASKAVYLSLAILKFDYSEMKREYSEQKLYFIDNGLLNAISMKFSADNGKLFENLCFLEFKRKKQTLYYFKDLKECDFVLYTEGKAPLPVQVCFDMADPDTQTRELKSLEYACKKLKVTEGIILSKADKSIQSINGIKIRQVDFIPWCLSNKMLN